MATVYSDQYTDAYVDVPSNKIAPGDISGKVLHAAFSITTPTIVAIDDIIKLVRLPKGAKLLMFRYTAADLGSAGDLDIGWSSSVSIDPNDSGEAGSRTGIAAAVDFNAAASANTYYPNREFAAAVDLQFQATEATTASGLISGYVLYTIV